MRERTTGFAIPTEAPADFKDRFVVSHFAIQQEDTRLLDSLSRVFNIDGATDKELEKANGSGVAYLAGVAALRDKGSKATPANKTLARAEFNKLTERGPTGELTVESLNAWAKS